MTLRQSFLLDEFIKSSCIIDKKIIIVVVSDTVVLMGMVMDRACFWIFFC